MKKMLASLVAIGLTVAILGCTQSPEAGGDSHEGHTHASATPKAAQTKAVTPTPGQKVEVAAGGTEFDPAVPADSIPDGSWACIMDDKVHYASSDKGAGECPVCGMNLAQTGTKEGE